MEPLYFHVLNNSEIMVMFFFTLLGLKFFFFFFDYCFFESPLSYLLVSWGVWLHVFFWREYFALQFCELHSVCMFIEEANIFLKNKVYIVWLFFFLSFFVEFILLGGLEEFLFEI